MRISLLLFGVSLLVFIVACTGQLPMAIADVERADAIDTNSMANVEQNTNVSPPDSPAALRIVDTEIVTQLTGSASPNATDARWNVHGTDLGHMFNHKGELYMVFGDTYGPDGGDWRSNTIARMSDPNPDNGFSIAANDRKRDQGQPKKSSSQQKYRVSNGLLSRPTASRLGSVWSCTTCPCACGARMINGMSAAPAWLIPMTTDRTGPDLKRRCGLPARDLSKWLMSKKIT